MGHEGAGIVRAIGPEVDTVQPGDRVLLNWAIPCGQCFQCRLNNFHLCESHSPVTAADPMRGHAAPERTTFRGNPIERSFNIGTLSTVTVVREEACVKIGEQIPFSSACIMGCGVMTGYGSVVNAAKVEPDSTVVVLGVGGVGLNVIQGARIRRAGRIIAVDLNSNRLEMVRQFGATDTLQAEKSDRRLLGIAEQVKKMTQGRGADYAFECTANPELAAAPLAMIRHGGMAVAVSGVEQEITIDMNLFEWDKLYINPLYGQCRPQTDFPAMLDLYRKGELLLDELITRTYRLDEIEEAFADLLAGKNAKGVVLMDDAI